MSESPLEPSSDPHGAPTEDPEIVPSQDPDGSPTVIPEPSVTNPDADGEADA